MCIQLGLLQRLEAMACEATAGARPPPDGEVRLGTWNVSHWSAVKADLIATTIGASILAVQETHLAPLPLEWAHTTARHLGLHLHHGRAAVPMANSPHGRSCGVGFVATSGVALSPVLPLGSPWRMLHSVRRLHAVQLPPRLGLPHGLLLLSVYAPLQERQLSAERARFVDAMLAVTHTLDMQVPTLLMGDFNGALIPAQDCRGTHPRPPCPLLSQLLGPGGAWVDVHAALLQPPLPWTFHSLGQSQLGASRIDLVLANHAAMPFLQSASVLSDLRDGGHSPVLVTLRFPSAATLVWHQPQPRLPALLLQVSSVLLSSKEWAALMERWLPSTAAQLAVNAAQPHSVHSLARALVDALQHLVTLSGGWSSRPPHRRPAYDSADVRRLRRRLTLLLNGFCSLQHLHPPAVGPAPGWTYCNSCTALAFPCWQPPSLTCSPRPCWLPLPIVGTWTPWCARCVGTAKLGGGAPWRTLGGSGRVLFITGFMLRALSGGHHLSSTMLAGSVPPCRRLMLRSGSSGWRVCCVGMILQRTGAAGLVSWSPRSTPTSQACRGLRAPGTEIEFERLWGSCGSHPLPGGWASPSLCGGVCPACGRTPSPACWP